MSKDADTLLQWALAQHRAGHLEAAESGYRQVLERVPGEPMALYLLGLTCFHRGDAQSAVQHIKRSLRHQPGNVRAWKDLGGILMASSRHQEARDAYTRAAEQGPQRGESWYNLGICCSKLGADVEAIAHLRQAIAAEPGFTRSYEPLALLLYRSGDRAGAGQVYQQWLQQEPDNPRARHMAQAAAAADTTGAAGPASPGSPAARPAGRPAAPAKANPAARTTPPTTAKAPARASARAPARTSAPASAKTPAAKATATAPDRASDDYIRSHFDGAATGFDANLEQLHYRAPQLLATTLERLTPAPVAALLDAGCGTGLCGPLVRARCKRLTGVDLSPAMLAQAAARRCYDELVEEELTAFMSARAATFDAVICADTLVYFGGLAAPLKAAHTALRPQGLLLFTLEAGGGTQPRLEIHGRYTHSEDYVRQALQRAGFRLLDLTQESLREERGQPVTGHLVSARRS